jgi:hypothetical protein
MKGADKIICQAAAIFLMFAVTSAPAKAQFGFGGGGGGGGEDMMTQMGPMLEMMSPMMRMANFGGGGFGGHRRHRH